MASSSSSTSSSSNNNMMSITPLGGGQEVGRSCILLQYAGRTVLLDCGTHPGREGSDALPFFDALEDASSIDMVLVTHFHIDHCAALPYLTEQTHFKGKIWMTHATKAVMKLLLSDNIRLQTKSKYLYSEQDLNACIDKIDVIDFHQTIVYKGIHVTASAAGHVLGAAMFNIEIDGVRVLYTGDYSMEEDRHLIPGTVPTGSPPDLLIVESTFGVTSLPPRLDREAKFTSTVHRIVQNGGCCLIPVFALGRAQELLLVLDEYWQAHPELQHVPVYYASRLASKALRVYQTFVNTMSDHIRDAMDVSNPFRLTCVQSMTSGDFNATGPCVVMAAPGFLQTGVSRELFEQWCEDEKNACIIAGYTVEGTLAHDLLSLPREIVCMDGRIKQRRCVIEHISFSAHVDYTQNSAFIRSVMPDNIILVHGEKTGMKRLKDELEREIRSKQWPGAHRPSVAMPENGVKVKLHFNKPVEAEIVGTAATTLLKQLDERRVALAAAAASGGGSKAVVVEDVHLPPNTLIVSEDFASQVLLPEDLSHFTPGRSASVRHRIVIPLPAGFGLFDLSLEQLRLIVEEVFEDVVVVRPLLDHVLQAAAAVDSSHVLVNQVVAVHTSTSPPNGMLVGGKDACVIVSWVAAPANDLVADAVIGVVSQAFSVSHLLRLSLNAAANNKDTLFGSRRKRDAVKSDDLLKRTKADA